MNALIIVDLQNDFLPGGALPVPRGHEVIPFANELQRRFDLVLATQDWHPPDHGSFAANHPGKKPGDRIILDGIEQILWPVHCVQNTHGAEFAPSFDRRRIAHIFHGSIPLPDRQLQHVLRQCPSRNNRARRLLEGTLHRGDIYLLGLALDYCVKYSALDARQLGFNTRIVVDACRGIGLEPGDLDRALDEMKRAGAILLESRELP